VRRCGDENLRPDLVERENAQRDQEPGCVGVCTVSPTAATAAL
jgi:hypothetical protein